MITIIDNETGNLVSVLNMLKKIEKESELQICMIKFQNPKYFFCLVWEVLTKHGKIYEKN